MDAAVLTKQMLGNARIKFVAAEIIDASEKLKLLWRHNQVEKPLFPTDGAAAILHFFLTRDVDAKAHSAAVAAALVVAIAVVVYQALGDAILTSNEETGTDIQDATFVPSA